MKKITLMVAESNLWVRKGYLSLLREEPDFKITGEAQSGEELLELIKQDQPNIALIDFDLPGKNGGEILKVIRKKFPKVKIVILSLEYRESMVAQFIMDGASSYLTKDCSIECFINTIRTVSTDGYCFHKQLSEVMVSKLTEQKKLGIMYRQFSLSEREKEVLKEICEGKTNKQISEQLNISLSTVDFHRQSIYKKTNLRSLVSLVKYAIKNGITKID